MTLYNWQQPDWPNFQYDLTEIQEDLFSIAEKMGFIAGKLKHLSKSLQTETLIDVMVEEAVKTSMIEGERINVLDVRSSIKNKLGLNKKKIAVKDKLSQGVSELMLDVRKTFKQSLTENKLLTWHLMLLSGSLNPNIKIASWRTDEEPMQIVSGYHGKWIVHYEAPPAKNVPFEMQRFIHWFNQSAPMKQKAIAYAPVRAAIAHLYFESIHPFDDGNGRIGRAIAEKALSQGFGYPVILSLSQVIETERKEYYAALKAASRSNEITAWIKYFVKIILRAQEEVEKQIQFVLGKTLFFQRFEKQLNLRQLKVVQKMLQAGIKGYEGGMSAKKYMKITFTSKATATRDLQDLLEMGAFKQMGEGRSVCYELNLVDM